MRLPTMALIAASMMTAGATLADDGAVRFRDQVAPILVGKCLACHGPKKALGRFRVDTYARLMGESDAGRAIEPGKPDESLCLELIEQGEPTGRMPKDAEPLPAADVATLRRWIEQGARFDGPDPAAEITALVPRAARPAAPEAYSIAVPIMALAFRPDGRELAVGGYREVTIWEPGTGRLLRRIPGLAQRTQGLAYSPDGATLAVAGGVPGESGELAVVDPAGGKPPRVIASASDLILGVAFSPDGSLVASAGADRTLGVFEVASGRELCRVKQFADWVTGVAFDREGVTVAGSSADKLVKVFDARTGKLRATYIGHQAPVLAVAFDPDSPRAVTAGADRKVHVWDPAVIAAEDGTAAQQEERFKKDISARTIDGFDDDVLKVVVARGLAYCASADGKVRVVDLATSKLAKTLDGHEDWIYALAVDPASGRLASGGFDGSVRVRDVESGRLTARFVAAPGLARADEPRP